LAFDYINGYDQITFSITSTCNYRKIFILSKLFRPFLDFFPIFDKKSPFLAFIFLDAQYIKENLIFWGILKKNLFLSGLLILTYS